nr:NADH-quinone oxidoreductase subunit J [Janibacter alkaliphilus]
MTVAAGALAVTSRQVVHAALWLVVSLLGLAGCYLVLGAELVALVQVLVYVGAVVVLVVFALMLTRAPTATNDDASVGPVQRMLAAAVAAGTTSLLLSVLLPVARRQRIRQAGSETMAEQIFSTWVWPFELISVLLIAALVAALAITRERS